MKEQANRFSIYTQKHIIYLKSQKLYLIAYNFSQEAIGLKIIKANYTLFRF